MYIGSSLFWAFDNLVKKKAVTKFSLFLFFFFFLGYVTEKGIFPDVQI